MAFGESRQFGDEDFDRLFAERKNWGRWGDDDQRGAVNLIDDEKRATLGELIRTGRSVSLSRPFPKAPAADNQHPALHFLQRFGRVAVDFYGISYHGAASTHIDALCHMWHPEGMWNGRDPEQSFGPGGAQWGDIEKWHDGIVTRGLLFDVPRFRGTDCVEQESPVEGWELEKMTSTLGLAPRPGDAFVIRSGRDAWAAKHGRPWGTVDPATPDSSRPRPGLHVSCLEFLRDHDCSVLVWDMLDHLDDSRNRLREVHAALYTLGVALVDNAQLDPLAELCAELNRFEFLFIAAPLRVAGGTGSPINPLALF